MTSTERQANLFTARGVLGMDSCRKNSFDKNSIDANPGTDSDASVLKQMIANDTSRIFDRLQQRDFVPRRVEHSAILAISGAEFAPHRLNMVAQRKLQDDIQQFSSQFFEIEIPERLQQWTALMNRAGVFPPLLRRLNELQPGLNLQIPTKPANEHQEQLLKYIVELFCLPAYQRIARRRRIVDDLAGSGEIRYWRSAMMTLDRRQAAFCRLTPQFCARVEQLQLRVPRVSDNRPHKRGISPTILVGMLAAVCLLVVNQVSPIFSVPSGNQISSEPLSVKSPEAVTGRENAETVVTTRVNFRLVDLLDTPSDSLGNWRSTNVAAADNSVSMSDEKWQQAYQKLTHLVAELRRHDAGNGFLKNASDVQLIDAVVVNTEVFKNQFPDSIRFSGVIDELCECGRILGYNAQKGDVMPNMMIRRARSERRSDKSDFRSLVGQPVPNDWDNDF